jgi:uncharacterized protein YyaL (SSP411 family)
MSNRLQGETSPYLLQHQHNPVDWYPWGEEAFARARSLDRPILLSVGYSACHWCHVMERESFEDEATARRMNEQFVCIKVDREERPEVDRVYQSAVQLMRRSGGWPLTAFLTPDRKPFFGGTYFPPSDRLGLPSFGRVLEAAARAFRDRRAEIERSAEEIAAGVAQLLRLGLDATPSPLEPSDVVRAGEALASQIDPRDGGFLGAPKFPHPDALETLLRAHRRGAAPAALRGALVSLERMAEGGLCDQLGGGFHRYSTDATWSVPHFEKMLYDNALLLHAYAEAFQLTGKVVHARAAAGIVAWLEREMRTSEGAFASSLDADSEGEEGRFYTFDPGEVEVALGAELGSLACARFGVAAPGSFEGGKSVLRLARSLPELARERGLELSELDAKLEEARRRLLEARQRRPAPGRDDKVLAGWNGLAVRGLARASRVFGRPEWLALARGAADFWLASMEGGRALQRSFRSGRAGLPGLLEDYGDLADGLVELFMATFDARALEAAAALADRAVALFWDGEAEAFLEAPRGSSGLSTDVYALYDDAWPSGASSLCHALVQLAGLLARPELLEPAGRYLSRMRASMLENPLGFGRLWCAADTFLEGASTLQIRGSREASEGLLSAVARRYAPSLAVSFSDEPLPPEPLASAFAGKPLPATGVLAYPCRHFSCGLPSAGLEVLDGLAAPEP